VDYFEIPLQILRKIIRVVCVMYEIRTGELPNTSMKRANVWRSRGIAPLSLNFGTMAVSGQLHATSALPPLPVEMVASRLRLKCDGTRAETRFRLSAKRTSPFKSPRCAHQW